MKDLIIIRHGQAEHNPRAEYAKANGCSHEEFVNFMRQDDVLDARLTPLGITQAQAIQVPPQSVELIVSSSLTRALETAEYVYPYHHDASPSNAMTTTSHGTTRKVGVEYFREISGDLLNAQRRTKQELQQDFIHWNFDDITDDQDTLWSPTMENVLAAAERGYLGFQWLLQQPESKILLVSHGGILRYTMNDHPLVILQDERKHAADDGMEKKAATSRFDNCEMRRYRLEWGESSHNGDEEGRRPIVLTQIDHELCQEISPTM